MTKQILRRRAIRVAVAAAMPVMVAGNYAHAVPATACTVDGNSNVVCSGTGTGYAFDGEGGSNTPDDINGHTITVKSGATISGQSMSPTGWTSPGTAGIFVVNGDDDEALPSNFHPFGGGGPLLATTYGNEGTTILIEQGAAISVTADTADAGGSGDLDTSGIYMDGSNNKVINKGTITVNGSANTVHWGVIFTGDDANNENPTMENYGTIQVLSSSTGAFTQIQGAVVMKESIINGVINNYEGATIHSGFASGVTGTSNNRLYGVYADDNAQGVTVNNWGTISVDRPTGCHSNGTSGNANCNAAVYLRAYDSIVNNYGGGTITGDIKVRDTTHLFEVQNAGLIDGYVVRQINNSATSEYNTTSSTGVAEHSSTTYIPVIKKGGGNQGVTGNDNLAAIGGYITGNFHVVEYNGATAGIPHEFYIKPKVEGAIVKAGDTYTLTGGNFVLDSNITLTNAEKVVNESALVTWSANVTNGEQLSITVDEVKSATSIAGINANSAKALEALLGYDGSDSDLLELGGLLQGLENAEDVVKASEQLRPEVNNAGMTAAMGIATQVQGVVEGRIGEVHLAKAGLSGIATGEGTLDHGFWLQGFGFQGDQDRRKGVDGYQADAGGIAFGGDTLINPDLRVGLAFSYGNTSVDAEGVNQGNTTDLDSYQALAYASFLGNGWYLNGSLGFAKHEFDTRRLVTVPLSETLTGSHDAWQYSAKVDAGYPFKMGNSLTLIPMASLAYSYLDQDGYTEKGGAAALSVKDVNTDSIRTGLGAKALVTLSDSREIKAVLEGRAMWFHEFGDDSQDTTASFAAGGGAFTTNGVELDRDAFNVGASLQIAGKNSHQSLTLSYDAEIKDEYFGQTAKLQARFEF